MSKNNRHRSQLNGGIFGNTPGSAGSGTGSNIGNGGGWGVGGKGKQASGKSPAVNPFMMPKPAGLNVFSNTWASNYYIEWNLSTWRAVCDQAIKQGYCIGYSTLVNWCFEASPFIQSLFKKLGRALDKIPFYCEDGKGNMLDDWTLELCQKPWQLEMRKEIMFATLWGFTGLNFDPLNEMVYKYPMQDIDPINRMLRQNTYSFYDGVYFKENANLLFIQPSTNYESFLGMMQPIAREFIRMNLTDNNWVASGTRLAFPILGVGYPQNDTAIDPDTEEAINPYKIEAERIAEDIDPTKGLVFPYTVNEKNEIIKSIMLEFEKPGTSASQHLTFKDFTGDKKTEIQELVFGRSLSNSQGKGNRALGEVEEEALNEVTESNAIYVLSVMNTDEFRNKMRRFYKNMPDDIRFNVDTSKTMTIPEIVQLSGVMVTNGKRFTDKFFEDQGISKDYFEDAPAAQEQKPTTEPVIQMAPQKKKFL